MNATHQYMLDSYRASRHGDQAPPQPGVHDWQVVREIRDYRRFQAVVTPRRSRSRVRETLSRWLHRSGQPRSADCH
ncbi:hypothetical protein J7E87_28300 [Streptomyces sp. ISL-1]|uniref:hypothetical protein n=1 Tax=Streptomyces sp. ISL-1 TaxID=2817657 RepID=UPI001BE735B4|nr:hypothetical protein [Streptomyces sp. ISL-1]MBT2393224.1 hypothetical protein [Streptomyces sp. ISL-1]